MLRKTLGVLALALVSLQATAQSCFRDGMVWKSWISGTTDGLGTGRVEVSVIDGVETVDGVTAMRLYVYDEGEESLRALRAYIRTDGDRVYFRKPGSDSDKWLLMYDFGLKAGEGCYVYDAAAEDGEVCRTYMRCAEVTAGDGNGPAVMAMEEYKDESCSGSVEQAVWLDGISSDRGIIYNSRYGMDGRGERLVEASCDGETYYAADIPVNTFFFKNMSWKTQVASTTDETCPTFIQTATLDCAETVDGYRQMQLYCSYDNDPGSFELEAYIRIDGDKVYFRRLDSDNDTWLLMYDFGLRAGEGCYVYNAYSKNEEPARTYVKCVGIKADKQCGWTVMSLEEYDDESCGSLKGTGAWLQGLASVNGLMFNNCFGMDGLGGMLLEASCQGKVYYHKITSGIGKVSGEERTVEKCYGINGMAVDADGTHGNGIVIRNGRKWLKR